MQILGLRSLTQGRSILFIWMKRCYGGCGMCCKALWRRDGRM
ncbi:hypothetical protein LINPERPRIM_LOCUS41031 [Linum perenne]